MAKYLIGSRVLLTMEITAWQRPQQSHLSVYLLPSLFAGITTMPNGYCNIRAGFRFLMLHWSVTVDAGKRVQDIIESEMAKNQGKPFTLVPNDNK